MSYSHQSFVLFVLAIPVACITWTVTHEDLVKEGRQWCSERSRRCHRSYGRKFFYLFTCEYCFSHYVSLFFIWMAHFKLLLPDWRGYVIAVFAVVWVSNIYTAVFGRIRLSIREERVAISSEELSLGRQKHELAFGRRERKPG